MRLSIRLSRRSLVCAAMAASLVTWGPMAMASVAAPFGLKTDTTQVLVVLDPAQSATGTLRALAGAGFGASRPVAGVPSRLGTWYLVPVSAADSATIARLRGMPGIQAARSVYGGNWSNDPILPNGEVIARFVPGTPFSAVQEAATQAGCTVVRQIGVLPPPGPNRPLPGAYVFAPNEPGTDPAMVAAGLQQNSLIRYSHPSLMFKLKFQAADTIEDPQYVMQWHLHNSAQLPGGLVGADIKAPEAWRFTMGEGAIAAVLDSDIQKDHEDLKDNYLTGYDFYDQDSDPSPAYGPSYLYGDPIGDHHGTCTSGLIVARANQVGVRGVAPMARLVGCKIGGGPFFSSDQDIADAFMFAEQNGAQVISNSWGLGGLILPTIPTAGILLPDLVSDAINEVATNGRSGAGVLVVFASGNYSVPIQFGNVYASLPNVMAVGATLRNDLLSCYSDYGDEQSVVAPGGGVNAPLSEGGDINSPCFDSDITTTDVHQTPGLTWAEDVDLTDPQKPVFTRIQVPGICRGFNERMRWFPDPTAQMIQVGDKQISLDNGMLVPDTEVVDFDNRDYTTHMNGTSAACPIAAGVATLVFSVNPALTAEQVRNLVEHTADKIQAPNETFDGVTGHNLRYGHGRVNAYRAVQMATAGHNWPSPVQSIQNVSSQALVRLFWVNPVNDIAGVLVVKGTAGALNWKPTDGVAYRPGQQVASGVTIVANDLIERLDQTGLQTGQYDYGIFVHNAENYYSWGRRAGFSAESPSNKPTAAIAASPTAGPAPLRVHLAGGGTDKVGLVSYRWDFGDGSTGIGPAVDHTYTRGGTYMATLTVVNTQGNSAQTTVQIVVAAAANQIPTVSIVATPSQGDAPLDVLFQANAADPDGVIASYDWDFGDGNTGTGQTVEHIYLVPGTYGVAVTVADNSGSLATATRMVSVTGTGQTAARTDPADALNSVGATPFCGAGTGAAVAGSMLALMMMRRRR
jgi:PKD repeat protein